MHEAGRREPGSARNAFNSDSGGFGRRYQLHIDAIRTRPPRSIPRHSGFMDYSPVGNRFTRTGGGGTHDVLPHRSGSHRQDRTGRIAPAGPRHSHRAPQRRRTGWRSTRSRPCRRNAALRRRRNAHPGIRVVHGPERPYRGRVPEGCNREPFPIVIRAQMDDSSVLEDASGTGWIHPAGASTTAAPGPPPGDPSRHEQREIEQREIEQREIEQREIATTCRSVRVRSPVFPARVRRIQPATDGNHSPSDVDTGPFALCARLRSEPTPHPQIPGSRDGRKPFRRKICGTDFGARVGLSPWRRTHPGAGRWPNAHAVGPRSDLRSAFTPTGPEPSTAKPIRGR